MSASALSNPISAAVIFIFSNADLIQLFLGLGLLGLYLAIHVFVVHKYPKMTTLGINVCERRRWVKKTFPNNNQLLIVQTLRNSIMASTYFATSSSAFTLFIITEAMRRQYGLQQVQLLALGAVMMAAFMNFLISIRQFNNLAFLACGNPQQEAQQDAENDDPEDPELSIKEKTAIAVSIISKAAMHYSYGVKIFFMVIPIGCWIISPTWFLISSVLLVIYFYLTDKA